MGIVVGWMMMVLVIMMVVVVMVVTMEVEHCLDERAWTCRAALTFIMIVIVTLIRMII